jgi:hypothetical protein
MLLKTEADTITHDVDEDGVQIEQYFKDGFMFMEIFHDIQRHEYFYGSDPFRIHSMAIGDSGTVTFVNVVANNRVLDGFFIGQLVPRYFQFSYDEIVNIENTLTSEELALVIKVAENINF